MGWIIIIIALMIPLVAIVLDSHLGRALADYVTRRSGTPPIDGGVSSQRLLALENEVERLNGEVLRLEEETQFLHRLLESKPSPRGELPPQSGS
ncbi:MAG TPA: hypothetical protein VFO52_04075 [Longimicrobiales bacterium]|nr:hypothetical protein [Longimicrobiales bacterium]